jgi:isoquinoline 1-oxidoreductase subunit beta
MRRPRRPVGALRPPQGVFRGLAQFHGYATYSAAVAEVSITNQGHVKIERIVVALDPGTAVNPAQIERQAAGSFVYGLSALLYGEITVKDGAVEQKNFDTYNLASPKCRRSRSF